MDSRLELKMWRQLKGAYSVSDSANFKLIFVPIVDPSLAVEQYDTMKEALAHANGQVCFLEPKGERCVTEIKDKDITLVIGNTLKSNAEYANADQMYKINTPRSTDLFGINATAIALSNWWYNQ